MARTIAMMRSWGRKGGQQGHWCLYCSHWTIHYSSHPTCTILIATWHHHHEWPLHNHPCTKSFVQYDTIISNNQQHHPSVRICLISWAEQMDTDVATNSTRRLISSLTNIPTIIIISSYVPTQSYITIKHVMPCHTTPPSIYHNWFDSIQSSRRHHHNDDHHQSQLMMTQTMVHQLMTQTMTHQLTTRMMTTNTIKLSYNLPSSYSYCIRILFVSVRTVFVSFPYVYNSRLYYPKREQTKQVFLSHTIWY